MTATGLPHNASIFVNRRDIRFIQIQFNGTTSFCNFDLQTGALGTPQGLCANPKIEQYENGFVRASVDILETTATSDAAVFIVVGRINANLAEATGQTGLFDVYGAQVADRLTSYIPTTTAAATRNADEPSQTYSFGATSGAIAIALKSYTPSGVIAEFNDASNTPMFKININGMNRLEFLDATDGDSVIADFEIDVTDKELIVLNWNGANIQIFSSNENPTVTITPWAQITNFAFTGNLNGEISKFDKFNAPITLAQFQQFYA
jgi:hypothetical protein